MFDIPVSNGQLASERLFYTSGDRVGELLAANSANSKLELPTITLASVTLCLLNNALVLPLDSLLSVCWLILAFLEISEQY